VKKLIRQRYDRGKVVTISWHLNNPLRGKLLRELLHPYCRADKKMIFFKTLLEKLAVFVNELKRKKGEFIVS
jgi:hypothetical protein